MALLLLRTDVNVIVVDWNHGAANLNYLKAVENTKQAAENLTAFIERMQVQCEASLTRNKWNKPN